MYPDRRLHRAYTGVSQPLSHTENTVIIFHILREPNIRKNFRGQKNVMVSHKSKSSSLTYGYMINILGHVGGGERCGGDILQRVTMTRWLIGLRSTQAKVEGIVPRVAWHWGINTSAISNHLREPGHIPFRPRRVPWAMTKGFFPVSWDISLTGGSKKCDNEHSTALETERTLNRDLDGGPRKKGAPLLGTLRGTRDFVLTGDIVHWGLRDIYRKESGNGIIVHRTPRWEASNSGGALQGEPGGKVFFLTRDNEGCVK
jgi:hypothetical protein